MKYGAIWKSDWFIGTIISGLFLSLYLSDINPAKIFELKSYDLAMQSNTHASDGNIVLLKVDSKVAQPEQQTLLAAAIDRLSAAGARVIALDGLHTEASKTSTPDYKPSPLVQSVRHSGNTLLPIFLDASSNSETTSSTLPAHIRQTAIKQINRDDSGARPIAATNLRFPLNSLIDASAGLGHLGLLTDTDGTVRSQPLIIEASGLYFPSMSLALAAKSKNIPLNDIRINMSRDIELGASNIATDNSARIYPTFYSDSNGKSFPEYSIDKLLSGSIGQGDLRNKIILLDSEKSGTNTVSTPLGTHISRSELSAHVLESILNEEFIQRPAWATLFELGLLLFITCYLVLLLPRIKARTAIIISTLLFALLPITGFIFLAEQQLWLQTMISALLLACGHSAFSLKRYLIIHDRKQTKTTNPDATNRMLGLSFQGQGMLEKAFEKFIACPLDKDMLATLYELALAFERKRQYAEAINVYQHMARHTPDYKDIQTRLVGATSAKETISSSDSNTVLSASLQTGDNTPTLGRYEIISELGKGAMGTVYLGKDPKINRQVAIKTMALSQEFEPDELEEVKARFFHEAEIAGMLNHPNIVTIFDAGDEHDLAYIAMEYLNGIDLVRYTKKGKLLPVSTVLKITAKVAEALQYAHDNGVIHRDIKPANIMILRNKTVKVTDFGIAHITESSKTKAGVVLGTPSYMSPEQLAGKTLDGRTDFFSLGVMLYEMVCGVRPFRGESISKLMYKIAKEPHLSPLKHNPDLPVSVVMLIDQLLAKKVDLRITSADEALVRIQQCLREIGSQEAHP